HDGGLAAGEGPHGDGGQRRPPLPQQGRRAMSTPRMITAKTKSWHFSRRTLLRGAGISLGLPVLEAMLDGKGPWLRKAQAATAAPVRVMAFHFPHGVILSLWTPATTGKGYAMTPGLMPLAPFQDDINILSGMNNNAAGKGPGGGHAQGMPAFATGMAGIGS